MQGSRCRFCLFVSNSF